MGSMYERFMARVIKDDGGCWEWTGATSVSGNGVAYGVFNNNQKGINSNIKAHRWSYQHHVGPLPGPKFIVDQSCKNALCVNPEHLVVVSRKGRTYRPRGTTGRVRVRRPSTRSLSYNIWSNVNKDTEHECWEWLGETNGEHALSAYQELVGPVPTGHGIDQLCGNTQCVNPDHMDIASNADLRAAHATRRLMS